MKLFHFDKERDYRAEFLPAALEIIEKPESPLGRYIIWSILAIVILTVLWSIIGKIDEVATASGKIIPDGDIKVLQSMEGGVITAIHVQEGQHVKRGQLLIELDTTINAAELDKLKIALETAKVEKALLKGYVYKVKVKPLATTLRVDGQDMPIRPGMTAEAEVKTGKRRIIEFFLPGIEEIKDGFELR